MKLYSLYESVILEGVDKNIVFEVLEEVYRVKINYAGDDKNPSGERVIEVYAYGKLKGKAENLAIRAYQIKGATTGSGVEGWKLFRVDRITSWEPVMKKNGRPDYFVPTSRTLFDPYKGSDGSMVDTIKMVNVSDFLK